MSHPPSKAPETLPSTPPEGWPPLMRLAQSVRAPIERFLHIEAASGILLLLAAAVALIWANSGWSASYFDLWRLPLGTIEDRECVQESGTVSRGQEAGLAERVIAQWRP